MKSAARCAALAAVTIRRVSLQCPKPAFQDSEYQIHKNFGLFPWFIVILTV
jgi:hypothetical protein